MLKGLKNQGFASVVEVIVTSVIFILAAAGILTTISMLRPQGEESARKLQAAYIGKGIIDDLRSQIDARTWNDSGGNFAVGTPYTINSIDGVYNVTYFFEDVPGLGLRKLTMNVDFPDE